MANGKMQNAKCKWQNANGKMQMQIQIQIQMQSGSFFQNNSSTIKL
jgi:hypothetical protein